MGVATNISLPQELELLVQKLEQLEALRHIAAQDAHDFNNCLTVILGNLSLADAMLADGDAATVPELLAEATAATREAMELSNQLQALARSVTMARQHLDLGTLVAEVVTEQQDDVRHAELECETSLPVVEAEAPQLKLAIAHLLRNAWEASGDQPARVEVTACAIPPGDERGLNPGPAVAIRVLDRGPGVPSEIRERIFQAGFTTKEHATGVGLTIARAIIRRHHGVLTLEPDGPGACFRLILPALPPGGTAASA